MRLCPNELRPIVQNPPQTCVQGWDPFVTLAGISARLHLADRRETCPARRKAEGLCRRQTPRGSAADEPETRRAPAPQPSAPPASSVRLSKRPRNRISPVLRSARRNRITDLPPDPLEEAS